MINAEFSFVVVDSLPFLKNLNGVYHKKYMTVHVYQLFFKEIKHFFKKKATTGATALDTVPGQSLSGPTCAHLHVKLHESLKHCKHAGD